MFYSGLLNFSFTGLDRDILLHSLCDYWINAFPCQKVSPTWEGTAFHLFCSPLYPQIQCMWEWAIVLLFSGSVASNFFVTLWIIAHKAPQSTYKDLLQDRGDAVSVCQVTEVNDCHVLSITARACPCILIATLWDHIIPPIPQMRELGAGVGANKFSLLTKITQLVWERVESQT